MVALSLVACGPPAEKKPYVEPVISIGVEEQWGPTDHESEAVKEAEERHAIAEALKREEEARLAEEKRLAEEEQKRIAELEAENQRKQKEAEEELLRQQQEAARQLEERLKNTPKQAVPPPPAPAEVPPANTGTPAWITYLMNQYNTYAAPGTVFLMTNDMPCGASAAGCTSYTIYADGSKSTPIVRIRPQYEGQAFLLFHGIAHTLGIGLSNECEADMFAKEVLGDYSLRGGYC